MCRQIKLLSFDLDDTLWPCMPTILAAEQAHYRWLNENVPAITSRYDIKQLREKRLALMVQNPYWAHDLSKVRTESLLALSEELDCGTDWVEAAFQVFYEARQDVTLFEDVEPVLDRLAKKYRMMALTNGNADISHTGISHWFEFAISAAEVGAKKSEPLIYQIALSQAGISARHGVHIGDDPVQDVLGAHRAGMISVWLNRKKKRWTQTNFQPDVEISSLHELPCLLEKYEEHWQE